MIARTWKGRALREKADDYQRHFETAVAANLNSIPGNRGAQLLRRDDGHEVEFIAITFWDSLETIKAFAGDNPDVAHIEPEGMAALSSFDDLATHHQVAYVLRR